MVLGGKDEERSEVKSCLPRREQTGMGGKEEGKSEVKSCLHWEKKQNGTAKMKEEKSEVSRTLREGN